MSEFFLINWYGMHDVWWRKIKKAKATNEQCYGPVFCVNTTAHARAQPSYEFRLHVCGRYARWRECQDSLSCWTGLELANEKDDERWRKELTWRVKTTAQSFPAGAGQKRHGLSKNKTLSSLSCQWAAEEAYMPVCCNNGGVVSLDRLFRWISASTCKSERKEKRCWPALRQKKVPVSSTWWHFFEVQQLLALWFSSTIRLQKLNFNKFDQWRIRRRMWSYMNSVGRSTGTWSHTKFI